MLAARAVERTHVCSRMGWGLLPGRPTREGWLLLFYPLALCPAPSALHTDCLSCLAGGAMLAMDLGFMGPNYSLSTACATGNYCILRCFGVGWGRWPGA